MIDVITTIIAKLQRELTRLHQQSIHNTEQTYVWMVAILINLPKCPRRIEVLDMVKSSLAKKTGYGDRGSPTMTS